MSTGAGNPPPPGSSGRTAERRALRGLLARTPLVTVTGPANVGKSTLARAVLGEGAWGDGRPGGGFVRVGCREGVDASDIAAALSRAAGLPYDAPPQTLAAHCARRGLTVLLDDCDPLAGACAWLVRQLLRAGAGAGGGVVASAGLRIVATARQPLGLGAERVLAVRPVPVTWGGGPLPVARDGGPLAAPSAPYGMAVRAPAAALGSCSPADRLVWARLAVLPGDFDGWLAGCVAGRSDVSAYEVEAALGRLLRASVLALVRPAPDTTPPRPPHPPEPSPPARPPQPPRYRLPAAARAMGRAHLRAAGEETATLRAFRTACAALAAEAQIAWQGSDRRVAVHLAETERHHLRAALTLPPQDAEDALTALDIAVSLWFRWAVCGGRGEGRTHLARLLRQSRDDTAVRARALWLAGWLAAQDHAHRTAESLLDRAGRAAARHADPDTLARVAHVRGILALRRSDTRTAAACLRRAAEHTYQDAWYGPGPAHSQVLLATTLAAPDPAAFPAPVPLPVSAPAPLPLPALAPVAATGATTTGRGTVTPPAAHDRARSSPCPGARRGLHLT
ncbi:ATP-binding protein [Streptomyces monomycini]|uniref:ATP-binding protein n=1 Tax=Streptomyces monomycini TaxID=371720 RepID=UPI00067DA608|nr:ATP-binding protein [Streptomyces monomycini]